MEIPSGYHFHPYDRELVEFYLLNKVIGKPIPYNPVMDCDLYGDPKIWSKIFEQTGMKTLYFYTQLKKKTKNGKQFDRATQFGTWRCQKDVQVYDSDDKKKRRHIGSHRSFSFKAKRGFDSKGKWTMHEFRLDGIYVNTKNPDDYVLCQINRVRGKTETVEDNAHKFEPVNVQLTFVEDHALKPEQDVLMSEELDVHNWANSFENVQQDVLTSEEFDMHNWANSFENVPQDVLAAEELELYNWANSLSIDMDYCLIGI